MEKLLEIKNLHTYFYTDESIVKAVEGLNLSLNKGDILGLVGESACGKTVSAYSIMRLVQPPARIVKGQIIFEGKDLLSLSDKELQKTRLKDISLVFQEPTSSLNPLYTIGFQISEGIRAHYKRITRKEVTLKTLELLEKVEIDKPRIRMKDYPHSLSGGQAQRVMIAMALSCNPKLLIADEPTTAIDVTLQAQIMNLFLKLKNENKFTLILITHDLLLASNICNRIAVMYAGRIVEVLEASDLFTRSLHPYTLALLASLPKDKSSKEKLAVIEGAVPDPSSKPSGCHFHPRCPLRDDVCKREYPAFVEVSEDHGVSCFKAP